MSPHVKVIAALFIVFGVMLLGLAFFTPLLMTALAGIVGATHDEGAAVGAAVVGLTGVVLSIVLFIFAVPYIVCGWGLLKLRRWARILGIILAALALIRFPFGTIFGVYALVILFRKDTEALFVT